MSGEIDPPFGTHALPPALERLRRLGAGSGNGALARRMTSLIRRVCMIGRPDRFDVAPFPGQRARLHPRDNLSEKRVFTAPAAWEAAERTALTDAMDRCDGPFRFVDAGANAGLYSLALRSHGPVRGLAIEPEPTMLARLRANIAASGAGDEVSVAPVALGAAEGTARLETGSGNRGEVRLSETGAITVPVRPLLDVVEEAGLDRIDALKMDIEGMEEAVLGAFLRDAPRALRPALVVIEAPRGARTPALSRLREAGYTVTARTRMNAILAGPAPT